MTFELAQNYIATHSVVLPWPFWSWPLYTGEMRQSYVAALIEHGIVPRGRRDAE